MTMTRLILTVWMLALAGQLQAAQIFNTNASMSDGVAVKVSSKGVTTLRLSRLPVLKC